MIRSRSIAVNLDHPAISPSVRKQPRQRPDWPSTVHTWMQGVATALGGRLEFGAAESDMGYDATRPRG